MKVIVNIKIYLFLVDRRKIWVELLTGDFGEFSKAPGTFRGLPLPFLGFSCKTSEPLAFCSKSCTLFSAISGKLGKLAWSLFVVAINSLLSILFNLANCKFRENLATKTNIISDIEEIFELIEIDLEEPIREMEFNEKIMNCAFNEMTYKAYILISWDVSRPGLWYSIEPYISRAQFKEITRRWSTSFGRVLTDFKNIERETIQGRKAYLKKINEIFINI
jgi:hypothetical protein